MIDDDINPYYDEYYDIREFNTHPYTVEDYRHRATRILSVESDLQLNKLTQADRGAYASLNTYIDIGSKKYAQWKYDYEIDFLSNGRVQTLDVGPVINGDDKLNELEGSHHEYLFTNSRAFGDNNKNYTHEQEASLHYLNAYKALLGTITHDIKLHGDFKLNAGRKIKLFFPKAIDPAENLDDKDKNEHLSGKYLITSAIHEFENDEYFVKLRVKKDSFGKYE